MHSKVFPVIEDVFPDGKWTEKGQRKNDAVLLFCKAQPLSAGPAYFCAHTQLVHMSSSIVCYM